MKYANRIAYLKAVEISWTKLGEQLAELPENDWNRQVPPAKKTGLSWSPKDVCGHVHGWHKLLLGWVQDGNRGKDVALPAKGFNWRQTPELNLQIYEEFRDVGSVSVWRRMKLSHGRVLKVVLSLSEKELLKPRYFKWTGKLAFISYVSPNTDGHYRWATRKLGSLARVG